MTNWLEIARRELPAGDKKRLSSVSAVGEVPAFEKLESFRWPQHTIDVEEILFNDSDEVLASGAEDKTTAGTTPTAKIAETPLPTIMAVLNNSSVGQSLPDEHAEGVGANVSSPQTKPPKIQKGPGEELPKLTKALASDERDKAPENSAADARHWRRKFENSTILVQRVRNLLRTEAERAAYDIVLVEFLNATHPDTNPNRCAWCDKPDELVPFGIGPHVWLHSDCRDRWAERRRTEAVATLAGMGIAPPAS